MALSHCCRSLGCVLQGVPDTVGDQHTLSVGLTSVRWGSRAAGPGHGYVSLE